MENVTRKGLSQGDDAGADRPCRRIVSRHARRRRRGLRGSGIARCRCSWLAPEPGRGVRRDGVGLGGRHRYSWSRRIPRCSAATSITSGGTLALPGTIDDLQAIGRGSTRDEAISYMKLCAEGRLSDAVIENFVDNANDFCVTLKDIFGWTKFEPVNEGYGDYYECYDGAVVDGPAHNVKPFDAQGQST